MNRIAFLTVVAAAGIAFPQAALAQESGTEVTVGAIAGYHDLGLVDGDTELEGFELTDNGVILGGFVAVDFPISENFFVGVEANAAFGTDAIDSDIGASARLGYRADNGTKVYLRGGYQEVDVDLAQVIGVDEQVIIDEIGFLPDVGAGDYLVGAGVDVPVGQLVVRANVDTIAFDSFRATAGVGFKF
ncbi:hypothetical protein ACI5KX_09605 [Erythrobacter sp. GH1-10]|uniref:hypothetical protein n=1 Tax=Erythrobacter sp. GH1-10 TaxID=3349334 RepID=UPI003877C0C4